MDSVAPAGPPSAVAPSPSTAMHPDSVDSSPRSRAADSCDEQPPSIVGAKLRLMCSYGGHIVPRPNDKSLCYVGGETRIVVVDRQLSLFDLAARLSKSLLNGRSFSLKYQLPNEDLDSLISVTTDEDLENMIDEYDRTSQSSHKPSRLRLFLFPTKTDSSASSIGSLLDNSTNSEDWFLNALNGASVMSGGFSESQSVNCLLGLDDGGIRVTEQSEIPRDNDANAASFGIGKTGKGQDVHSVPDSPMMETSSSFGSSSSSPSLANLPPIRVHVDETVAVAAAGDARFQEQKLGVEEQFAQMNLAGLQNKQDDGFVMMSSPPPIPNTIVSPPIDSSVPEENQNPSFSDSERSEQGIPAAYSDRKSSHPRTPVSPIPPQPHQKTAGVLDLPPPDALPSHGGTTQPRAQPSIYQDPINAYAIDPKLAGAGDPTGRVHMIQQIPESGYVFQPQYDQQQQQQQQFVHAGAHYLPAGPVPIQSYYQVYHPSQQQHHHHRHPQLNPQQFPVYLVPARSVQTYNPSMQQPKMNAGAIPTSRLQPQAPTMASPANYMLTRNVQPEIAQNLQVPSSPQFMGGISQIHHHSHPVLQKSGYEIADSSHAAAQFYYAQPYPPPQYQTISATAPSMVISDSIAQAPPENAQPQPQPQIRTQPPF